MTKKLETRMYFLTMYNISEIQKGIQCLHSCVEYQQKYGDTTLYKNWAKKHKTVIVLNGGTSNDGKRVTYDIEKCIGSMEQHKESLDDAGILNECFYEPDLNWCMTSIAFIVDERVFNKEDYPDFKGYCSDKLTSEEFVRFFGCRSWEILPKELETHRKNWLKLIGGEKNAFLKDFCSQFRLA